MVSANHGRGCVDVQCISSCDAVFSVRVSAYAMGGPPPSEPRVCGATTACVAFDAVKQVVDVAVVGSADSLLHCVVTRVLNQFESKQECIM